MRKRLNAFAEFARTILPHEIDYLLSSNQLQDGERLAILQQVRHNIQQQPPGEEYDLEIDKRTYSHLKNWIQRQLQRIDVDVFYQWISELDVKIVNDSISPDEERHFLRVIQAYEAPGFFFTRLFEVLENYSNFLLIRLRYKDHQIVDTRLKLYRESYLRHKEIQKVLQEASSDIVDAYHHRLDGPEWRSWLTQIFTDESVQGFFRYQALIRLHFMDLHAPDNAELQAHYQTMGRYFAEGKYYSRRLLINYYHNLMLLRHRSRDFGEALQYGYLSTRVITHDFLLHVNNLCDVLVQLQRYEEGLALLRSASKEAKNTNNFFNRVGFVAFYMRCLIGTGKAGSAVSYGSSFLAAYRKEVMKYRWFRFFNTFLEALLHAGEYKELLRVCRKFRLLELEAGMQGSQDAFPKLALMQDLARYLSGDIEATTFSDRISGPALAYQQQLLAGDLNCLHQL